MDFRILGPLEVVHDGEPVRPGGPREQAVLAILLLEADRLVPVGRLIDAVWDDLPPVTARNQVQASISSLRRRLLDACGQNLVETRNPGYRLRLGTHTLDSRLFEERLAAGRKALADNQLRLATAELRGALSLWRGTALSGLDSRVVQLGVVQLNESRLLVLEDALDCELRGETRRDLVGELIRLVREHPLRERFRALLIKALFQAGRRAEALEAYRQARTDFVEALGIEPGPELRQLHQTVLTGGSVAVSASVPEQARSTVSPATALRGSVPRLLPTDIADFTGREPIVQRIIAEVRGAGTQAESRGRPGADRGPVPRRARQAVPICVLVGRPGAGKTTLAVHVAHRLAADFPDGQLFARLRSGDRRTNPADVLERFLRALGLDGAAVPQNAEERAEVYRGLLSSRRVLIVLDDVMSEQQISGLIPGASQCSVLITSRKRLTGLPAAYRAEVGMFSRDSAIELLAGVVGAERILDAPAAVDELCVLCGNLPLALRIVAARLAARPHWTVADLVDRLKDESSRLDELNLGELGVRAGILLTYQDVSPDARTLFRRLALSEASDFPPWVGSPLLQTDVRRSQDLLDELAEAFLLDTEPASAPGFPRYRFHDLTRPFARERLNAEESAWDRRRALENLLGSLLFLAGEAHRREYSGDFVMPRSPASQWPLPGPLVDRLLEDPLSWYEQERSSIVVGVRQAAASGMVSHAWSLALAAVTLFEAHTYLNDWRDTHEVALEAACRAGDVRGEAVVRYSLGSLFMFEHSVTEATAQFEQARVLFERLGDRHEAALVLRNMAYLDRMSGNLQQALESGSAALDAFRAVGDRIAEAHVLQNLAQVHIDYGNDETAGGLLEEAAGICRDLGNRRVGAQVLHRIGELHLRQGRVGPAADAFAEVLTLVTQGGDRVGESYALLGLARARVGQGDLELAGQTLGQVRELAAKVGERVVEYRAALCQAELELRSGLLHQAEVDAALAERGFADLGVRMHQAHALAVKGRIQAAAGAPEVALAAWEAAKAVLSGLKVQGPIALAAELERDISALARTGESVPPMD
jgi:DNA-binding SARP family transcriptional activator/tetratricopeptide (TPR) repeat protein